MAIKIQSSRFKMITTAAVFMTLATRSSDHTQREFMETLKKNDEQNVLNGLGAAMMS